MTTAVPCGAARVVHHRQACVVIVVFGDVLGAAALPFGAAVMPVLLSLTHCGNTTMQVRPSAERHAAARAGGAGSSSTSPGIHSVAVRGDTTARPCDSLRDTAKTTQTHVDKHVNLH
jgi:hypothetical protein